MKKIFIFLFVIIASFMMGCRSMAVTPAPSEAAVEYREIQSELQARQTETAITGIKIEEESREIVSSLDALETAMIATPDTGSYWLPQVRELQIQARNLEHEAENLNRQLSAERETNGRLNSKFNAYETAQTLSMAEKDTEINVLRVEVKKVTGQKNTLLAIVITAITVIVLFVAFKVLRALRVIPF